jgi:hypothetical protein
MAQNWRLPILLLQYMRASTVIPKQSNDSTTDPHHRNYHINYQIPKANQRSNSRQLMKISKSVA